MTPGTVGVKGGPGTEPLSSLRTTYSQGYQVRETSGETHVLDPETRPDGPTFTSSV